MLTVQRVPGGARKALLQRRVVQLGSLTARRDRLLEPDAMAAMPTREGAKRSGPSDETQLLGGGGPPAHFVRPRKKARLTLFSARDGRARGPPLRPRHHPSNHRAAAAAAAAIIAATQASAAPPPALLAITTSPRTSYHAIQNGC